MIRVQSHSLGVNTTFGEPIVHTKYFKKYGIWCCLYIFYQMIFEDYINVEEI